MPEYDPCYDGDLSQTYTIHFIAELDQIIPWPVSKYLWETYRQHAKLLFHPSRHELPPPEWTPFLAQYFQAYAHAGSGKDLEERLAHLPDPPTDRELSTKL